MKRLYKKGDWVVFKKSGDYGFLYTVGDLSIVDVGQSVKGGSFLLGPSGQHDTMFIRPDMVMLATRRNLKRVKELTKMRVIRD